MLLPRSELLETIAAPWHVSRVLPGGVISQKRIENVGCSKKCYVGLGSDQENRSHFIYLSKGILGLPHLGRMGAKEVLEDPRFSVGGTKVHSGILHRCLAPLSTSNCFSIGSPNAP